MHQQSKRYILELTISTSPEIATSFQHSPPAFGQIRPPRFFVNNLRFVANIDAKLGIPFCTSILRYDAKFWTILSIFLSYVDFSDPLP